jgi:hypothetical protein
MIAPQIQFVRDGQILSTNLVNSMIGRIEYAADLLRQYKLIAGDEMYVEPHFDGTRVSYFYPVAGGATPRGSQITIPKYPIVQRPLSPTDGRYNAQVLLEDYKPGNEPETATRDYWQPFIDGVPFDSSDLVYPPGSYLKWTVSGVSGALALVPFIAFVATPGSPAYFLLPLGPGVSFQLIDFYFGPEPSTPENPYYPTGTSFSIVATPFS